MRSGKKKIPQTGEGLAVFTYAKREEEMEKKRQKA